MNFLIFLNKHSSKVVLYGEMVITLADVAKIILRVKMDGKNCSKYDVIPKHYKIATN